MSVVQVCHIKIGQLLPYIIVTVCEIAMIIIADCLVSTAYHWIYFVINPAIAEDYLMVEHNIQSSAVSIS